jgi:thioredoxin 2
MNAMASLTLDDRGIVLACKACGQRNRLLFGRLDGTVRCAKCKELLPSPSEPIEISTTADFDRVIAHASVPVLVDYWAPWCGPCRIVAPEVQKVAARQAGRAVVVKVNTDELADVGQRFGIRSIPTLAVFAGGREVTRAAGARAAPEIEALLQQAAPAHRP